MKAVILAGGLGTRLSEETLVKPKPMVEIGGKPIIWHILKIYSSYGINDFIICCGYKGHLIKDYFSKYFLYTDDISIDCFNNQIEILSKRTENWNIKLINTGENTLTGGRLKRISKYLDDDESFCFTYGDGVSNVNIKKLISFHKKENRLATVTAVQPAGRFGIIECQRDKVLAFQEKPKGDIWINGGFFVLKKSVLNLIQGDNTIWEEEPLKTLAKEGQLSAFHHNGFWQPMDTLKDKLFLEETWKNGNAPWKVW